MLVMLRYLMIEVLNVEMPCGHDFIGMSQDGIVCMLEELPDVCRFMGRRARYDGDVVIDIIEAVNEDELRSMRDRLVDCCPKIRVLADTLLQGSCNVLSRDACL